MNNNHLFKLKEISQSKQAQMLSFIINIFQFYTPILLGATYVLGYERKKLDNLLKFFIITIHLQFLLKLIQNSFQTKIFGVVAVPVYLYLTLFHYTYSGIFYDIIFSPLFSILLEWFEERVRRVEKQRIRARINRQDGQITKSEEGYFQELLINTFRPDNILLLG